MDELTNGSVDAHVGNRYVADVTRNSLWEHYSIIYLRRISPLHEFVGEKTNFDTFLILLT